MDDEPRDRLIPMREVVARVGLSKATIYRLMERGVFPRPHTIRSLHAVRWSEAAVDAFIKGVIADKSIDATLTESRS